MKNLLIVAGVAGFLLACGGGGSSSGGGSSNTGSGSGSGSSGGATTQGTYCALDKSSYTDSSKGTLVRTNDPNCGTRCDGGTMVGFYRPTLAVGETSVNDARCTTSIAGSYTGTLNYSEAIVYTSSAASSLSTDAITVVIAVDGTVTVNSSLGAATGTLAGEMFTSTIPGSSYNSPGFACSGTITFRGELSGMTINGTLESTINCVHNTVPANNYTVTHDGTYTATR